MTRDWRQAGAVTRGEAAEILHVSTGTLDSLIERGDLHAFRAGRCVRIPVHALRVMLGEVEAMEEAAPARQAPELSARGRKLLREARRKAG